MPRRRASPSCPAPPAPSARLPAARPRRHPGRRGTARRPSRRLELSRAVALACWDEQGAAVPRHPARRASPAGCSATATRTAPRPGPCWRRSPPPPPAPGYGAAACPPVRPDGPRHVGVRQPRLRAACPRPTGQGRGVGRLLAVPASTCPDCGSRVLELLYCYECGDVSLGGYVVDSDPRGQAGSSSAPPPPTSPRSRRSPSAGAAMASTCGTGRATGPSRQNPSWTKSAAQRQAGHVQLRPAELDPALGMLVAVRQATGWYLSVSMKQAGPEGRRARPARPLPALRAARLQRETPEVFWRGEVRSPVRGHTTGIAQSTQLYLSQLVRSMGDTPAESRTILFTDSRDDAARTAAGVARNHFRDLVRQLIRQVMDERAARPARRAQEGGRRPRQPRRQRAVHHGRATVAEHPEAWTLVQKEQFVPLAPEEQAVLDALAPGRSRGTEDPVGRAARPDLDPAGQPRRAAGRSRAVDEHARRDGAPWYQAYPPPRPGAWTPLPGRRDGERADWRSPAR